MLLGALYYLCNPSTEEEVLKPEVVKVIEKFADAGAVNVSFCNLARAFLDKHVSKLDRNAGKQMNQWAFQNHIVPKSS